MREDMLWDIFAESGRIDDYLKYSHTHLCCKLPNRFRDKILSAKEQTADGVRVSSGHLCKAEAPTEPTGKNMSPVEDLQRRMTKF